MSNDERADNVVTFFPNTEADVERIASSFRRSSYSHVVLMTYEPVLHRLDAGAIVRALPPTVQSFSLFNLSIESLADHEMAVNQGVQQLAFVGCWLPSALLKFSRLQTLHIRECTIAHEILQQLLVDNHSTLRTVELMSIPPGYLPALLVTLLARPRLHRCRLQLTGEPVLVEQGLDPATRIIAMIMRPRNSTLFLETQGPHEILTVDHGLMSDEELANILAMIGRNETLPEFYLHGPLPAPRVLEVTLLPILRENCLAPAVHLWGDGPPPTAEVAFYSRLRPYRLLLPPVKTARTVWPHVLATTTDASIVYYWLRAQVDALSELRPGSGMRANGHE